MPVAEGIRTDMTQSSWIRRMFERGNELRQQVGAENVFDFTLGNPYPEPPKEFYAGLREVAARQDEGLHRYMPNAGFSQVRQAVAAKLARNETFPGMTGDLVTMSVGAGGGMNVSLKAILNPGEEVVVLAPYFPEYLFYIKNHGGKAVIAETDDTFDLDMKAIEKVISAKTRALIINTPNNPTGRVYPRESLLALAELLRACEKQFGHSIYLLADEPYRELSYVENLPPSPAAFHRNSFLIYSWSKSLSVPGERIGYVAINPACDDPKGLADGVAFTTRTLGFVNAPATMQLIVEKILDVTIDVGWYRKRRDRLLHGLRDLGVDVVTPEGTFYIFPKSPDQDDVAFVARAVEERVLLVPGSGFGRPGYFRLSYCVDDRTIEGGLLALGRALGR